MLKSQCFHCTRSQPRRVFFGVPPTSNPFMPVVIADSNTSIEWTLVQRSASQPTFDLSNLSISAMPCSNSTHQWSAVCLIRKRTAGTVYWDWSAGAIGHSVQYLFKCWSFWLLLEERHGQPVEKIIVDTIHRRTHWNSMWSERLMDAMGARFVDPRQVPNTCSYVYSVVTRSLMAGDGDSFFAQPWMAQRLVSIFVKPEMTLAEGFNAPLSVGVLNRLDSRGWPDARRFVAMLQDRHQQLHSASAIKRVQSAEVWVNDNLTLVQQLQAVRRHQLLIGPHGAQNANWAFANPCTVALEFMPHSFIIMEYQQIMIDVGGRAFFLYNGSQPMIENLKATQQVMRSDIKWQFYARVQSGVDRLGAGTVINTLGALIQARDDCVAGVPLQTVPFDGVPTLGGLQKYITASNASHGSEVLGYCYYCGGTAPCCAHSGGLDYLEHVSHGDSWECRGCPLRHADAAFV